MLLQIIVQDGMKTFSKLYVFQINNLLYDPKFGQSIDWHNPETMVFANVEADKQQKKINEWTMFAGFPQSKELPVVDQPTVYDKGDNIFRNSGRPERSCRTTNTPIIVKANTSIHSIASLNETQNRSNMNDKIESSWSKLNKNKLVANRKRIARSKQRSNICITLNDNNEVPKKIKSSECSSEFYTNKPTDRLTANGKNTNVRDSISSIDNITSMSVEFNQIGSQILTSLHKLVPLIEDKFATSSETEKSLLIKRIAELQVEKDLTIKHQDKENNIRAIAEVKVSEANDNLNKQQRENYQNFATLTNNFQVELANANKEMINMQKEHSKELSKVQKEQNDMLRELLTNNLNNYKDLSTLKEKQTHHFRMAKIGSHPRYDDIENNN
jgi:hypothetical protein